MAVGIGAIKCTHVVVQVNLGYFDADGNLVGEQTFPQTENGPAVAKLFYPHDEQLTSLMEMCVQQAWANLEAAEQAQRPHSSEAPEVNHQAELAPR